MSKKLHTNPTTQDIIDFYFEATRHGWEFGGKSEEHSLFPGYKCYRLKEGIFSYLDAFCLGKNEISLWGFKTIWVNERPYWNMHYAGWHSEESTPTLKQALRDAVEKEMFLGGRGPATFYSENNNLFYTNKTSGDIGSFKGNETIFDANHHVMGHCNFSDGIL